MVPQTAAAVTFDPGPHLITIARRKGKGGAAPALYLPVAWRLVWLRLEHPEASVRTELVRLDLEAGFALFRAEVSIPGQGSATGYGSETARDFVDFIERAETRSIGRALGALGYGTAHAPDLDLDEGPNGDPALADAPVVQPPTRPAAAPAPPPAAAAPAGTPPPFPAPSPRARPAAGNGIATPDQLRAIYALAQRAGLPTEEVERQWGRPPEKLTRQEAGEAIRALQAIATVASRAS